MDFDPIQTHLVIISLRMKGNVTFTGSGILTCPYKYIITNHTGEARAARQPLKCHFLPSHHAAAAAARRFLGAVLSLKTVFFLQGIVPLFLNKNGIE